MEVIYSLCDNAYAQCQDTCWPYDQLNDRNCPSSCWRGIYLSGQVLLAEHMPLYLRHTASCSHVYGLVLPCTSRSRAER